MTDWGPILGVLAILVGMVFGILHLGQSERHNRNLSQALNNSTTRLGEGVASDLKELGKATLEAIQKNGDVTIQAIEKDGAESRRTILAVHKSIKEELVK